MTLVAAATSASPAGLTAGALRAAHSTADASARTPSSLAAWLAAAWASPENPPAAMVRRMRARQAA